MNSILQCCLMIMIPPILGVAIHNYLKHGELSGKRKIVLYCVYLFSINFFILFVSYCRGVEEIHLIESTTSYKLKYLGLGCVIGFFIPFLICLLTEDIITLGGFKRYAIRFLGDIKKYIHYAMRAARADLNAEVANSYLDWLWWLIEPFCNMLIYAFMFGIVFKASEEYFPIFIFIGITMWNFFTRNITASIELIRKNKGIITKVYMPKFILLLSKMFVNEFKMLVSFGVIVGMMIVGKVVPTINVLYAVPICLVMFLLTFGIGTIMMHYGVYVNDLSYIVNIVLNMLNYLTGTFYSVGKRIPAPFGEILEKCNPMAFLIKSMRDALLYGQSCDVVLLTMWFAISCVLVALGCFTIYSNENSYVKVI